MSKRIVFFLLLTGCSYANDGRAISQLFFLLALFITACTGGGKFKATDGDATDVTDSTDITAPTGAIFIAGDITITTERAVALTFTTDDASEIRFSESDTLEGAEWAAFAESADFVLSVGNGTKTVYAQFRDVNGNESEIVSDSIELQVDVADITPPTGTISINGGAGLTSVRQVSLGFSADDAVEVRYGESASLNGSTWLSYASTKGFTLSAGNGTKTVYAQFRDNAGNESNIVSDSITLDEASYGVLGTLVLPALDTISGPIKTVGDVNGDGKDDLIARFSSDGSTARVVLGGANTSTPVTLDTGVRGFSIRNGGFNNGVGNIVSGDVNGDGRSDLALIRDLSYSSSVEIVHGRAVTADVDLSVPGDGGRTIQNVYSNYGRDVKLGDVNGDGRDDIVIPQDWNSKVRVVFGDAATGVVSASALTVAEFFDITANLQESKYQEEDNVVVLGDFNGDGKQDIFLQKYRGATYGSTFYPTVIFGDSVTDPVNAANSSTRRFVIWGSSNYLGTKNDAAPVVGDFNGDGKDDLVFPSKDGSRVTVVFGSTGSGNFGADVYANNAGSLGGKGLIITGDFAPALGSNPDVLYTGSQTSYGNNYYTPKTYTDHYFYREKAIQVADVNGDGKDDIIIAGDAYSDQVYVVFGGTMTPNYKYYNYYELPIGDAITNGDAISIGGDLGAQSSYIDGSYSQYNMGSYNSGYPYYTTRYYFDRRYYNSEYNFAPKLIAAGNFDADGFGDIVVANQSDAATLVLGKSSPSAVNTDSATTGVFPLDATDVAGAVLLDYNGDGFKDVATVSSDRRTITIFGRLP